MRKSSLFYLPGSSCGNVMTMLPYLGVETYPIGHFDDSRQGLKITSDLKRYGADTRFVKNSPDGLKNYAIFNENKVVIKKIEHIEVVLKEKKYLLVEKSKEVIYI